MKRNFLLLALSGAFAFAILANASRASATCPVVAGVQTVGTQLNGNYAIKIVGAQTDSGTSTGDPMPVPIMGIGVIAADGACDITGGEFIYNDGGTYTGPAAGPYGSVSFSGSLSANIVAGTGSPAANSNYYFNSNNQGVLTLVDSASGNTFQFAITFETANTAFRGARLNPGDPVGITGQYQAPVTTAQFEIPSSINFDSVGNPTANQFTGGGQNAIEVTEEEHLDPETGTILEGGGNAVWNDNNGNFIYCSNCSPVPSFPPGGGAFVWDFHQTILAGPSTADGTQTSDWGLNGDFAQYFSNLDFYGEGFQTASVVWGSSNQYQWVMITAGNNFGTNDSSFAGVGIGTGGKVTATGTDHLSAASVTLTSSVTNPNPSATITITNDSVEPLDYTGLTLSASLSNVTISGGTCTNFDYSGWPDPISPANNVASNFVLYGPGTCTIILTDSGASCTRTGSNYQTGTLEIVGNDHTFLTGTQTSTGLTIPVTCQ